MKTHEMQERLILFTVNTINVLEKLPNNFVTQHLRNQLFRSTSSIALNYDESSAAESTKDFLHKRRICLKEAKESEVTIKILMYKRYINNELWQPVEKECG